MRKQIVTLLLTLSALTVSAQDKDLEGLYRQIDEAIDHFPEYVARHETQISDASRAYRLAHQPADQYAQAFRLYELYRAYKSDSALIYLDKAERAAAAMNRTDLVGSCCALKAFQCSTVGLYHEALELLNTVDKSRLDSTREGTEGIPQGVPATRRDPDGQSHHRPLGPELLRRQGRGVDCRARRI